MSSAAAEPTKLVSVSRGAPWRLRAGTTLFFRGFSEPKDMINFIETINFCACALCFFLVPAPSRSLSLSLSEECFDVWRRGIACGAADKNEIEQPETKETMRWRRREGERRKETKT